MTLILGVTITSGGKTIIIPINIEVGDVDQFAFDYRRILIPKYGRLATYSFTYGKK
jgi:hypothetical protein